MPSPFSSPCRRLGTHRSGPVGAGGVELPAVVMGVAGDGGSGEKWMSRTARNGAGVAWKSDSAALGEWAREQQERRRRFDEEAQNCRLKPPEAFSGELAPPEALQSLCPGLDPALTGRGSHAVGWRIARSCCGWRQPPTTEEFYDAFHTDTPDQRQRSIIYMWGTEATFTELLEAWAQGVYTFRELVRALHLADFPWPERIAEINQWADPSHAAR